ncbi:phosphoribosyltransferase family protein [Brachybacterium paraconglomeratum]|uniref:ComF family protein n=1 Tax=Brachybacterium paraconglomeratum TaxID=173362 RepID=UPI0031E982FD
MTDTGAPTLWRMLREAAVQTCALVAPRQCPCGREDTRLCPHCTALLESEPCRVESCCDALQELSAARVRDEVHGDLMLPAGVDHTPLLPVLALGEYGGDLQRLILAWKNGGMLHLGARIAPALSPAVARLAGDADGALPFLVPVPSQRSARLRRGEDHTAELVRAMERSGAGRALLLRAQPTTAQEGQGARQRRNRQILLRGRAARQAGLRAAPVVIVDDVVTTGSTLRGMHQALTAAGMQVLGAVVVASARVPTEPRTAGERTG